MGGGEGRGERGRWREKERDRVGTDLAEAGGADVVGPVGASVRTAPGAVRCTSPQGDVERRVLRAAGQRARPLGCRVTGQRSGQMSGSEVRSMNNVVSL